MTFNTTGLLTLTLILLTSCSTLSQKNIINPTSIHDANGNNPDENVAFARNLPVEDYYRSLMLAKSYYSPDRNCDIDSKEVCYKPSKPEFIRNYVTEGLGLVDAYCLRWFNRLDESQRKVQTSRTNYNIITQLGSTLLSASSTNYNTITGFNAANTAFTRVADNYTGTFLFANTTKVKQHIFKVMKDKRTLIESRARKEKNNIKFKDFYIEIEQYADICTFSNIKEIVNKSLDATQTYTTADGQQETNAVDSAAAQEARTEKDAGQQKVDSAAGK